MRHEESNHCDVLGKMTGLSGQSNCG
jgi:hypothetical protein